MSEANERFTTTTKHEPKIDRVSKNDILSCNKVISGLSATAWLLFIIDRYKPQNNIYTAEPHSTG